MSEFIQFLVIGLGLGAVYALTSLGLVVIHRGSGVVNFANSGIGLVGAYVYWELYEVKVPAAVCVLIGLLAAAALGALAHQVVMRRLWSAAQLTRVIATLGMLGLIDGLFTLRLGDNQIIPPYLLPNHALVIDGRRVSSYNLYLFVIALVIVIVLQFVYRRTKFGLLTTATAENRRATSALGHSADRVSMANWALGSALAALAAILIGPLLSLSVTAVGLLLVPALAAAVLGDFRSFPLTFAGAMLVGVGESMVQWANLGPGWPDAVPFIAVIAILCLKGSSLPGRSAVMERLPKVGPGTINWRVAAAAVAVVVGLSAVASGNVETAMFQSAALAIILLSSVVVTGYAGQLSLAQLGLAGAGAFIGARVAQAAGLGFWPALLIAIACIVPIGVICGLPALRTRGVNLAIVTLGIGVVVDEVVLSNVNYTGGIAGTQVKPPSLFGFSLDAEIHPQRYFLLCLVILVLCALAVSNLRRSTIGRYLVAVRGNERAAASLGLNVAKLKLYAFAVSAVLAAIGGILIVYQTPFVDWSSGWDVVTGIALLAAVVIAGLGYTSGPLLACVVGIGGVVPYLISTLGENVTNWIAPVLGLGLIVGVIKAPDGVIAMIVSRRARRRPGKPDANRAVEDPEVRGDAARASASTAASEIVPKSGSRLEIEGLGVSFGGVRALHDVSFSVGSGEVLGLIGPNGAGKTTLIDIVTGVTRPKTGTVKLDGRTLNRLAPARRARAGLARSFQMLELFEDLTVEENLLVASEQARWWTYLRCLVLPKRGLLSPAAIAAVHAFGLEGDLARHPSELSFGHRRLVGIARAVAGGASIVLLDEPAAGLDERESAELAELLRMLADTWGIGILLVEHDMSLVMKVSDRIAALDFGELIACGDPQSVRTNPRVMTAYLGLAPSDPAVAEVDRATAETMSEVQA
jgi:ABC-type branched-subunit amino acid transport system ATPase component/branched-subunit amino acid ABC-type transport system permease component